RGFAGLPTIKVSVAWLLPFHDVDLDSPGRRQSWAERVLHQASKLATSPWLCNWLHIGVASALHNRKAGRSNAAPGEIGVGQAMGELHRGGEPHAATWGSEWQAAGQRLSLRFFSAF